jgi:predicted PurR-regulated permease PerM
VRITNAFKLGFIGMLGVGLGILLLTAISSLANVLLYIGIALFLALGLDPVVNWLVRKRVPRWAALLSVVVVVLGSLVGLMLTAIPTLVHQLSTFFTSVPDLLHQLQTQEWVKYLDAQFGSTIDVNALITELGNFFKDPKNISAVAGGALAVGAGIATGVTGTIVVIILTLYFTASLQTIKNFSYSLVPASKRDTYVRLSEQISSGVGKYVGGQFTLAAINGVLTFIVLTIIGGKLAIVFAFIAFLLALVPLIGTVTASVIITVSQLGLAGPETAIAIGIYFLIYMQIEAYVFSPRIMNKAVEVPGATVVIAALAGGTLLGIFGALIAIPIAAAINLIIREIIIPAQNDA